MRAPRLAEFPDCVAARSAKHLGELADMVAGGARAVLVYVIQMDAERFDVARDIDPAYDAAFRTALAAGVESYAYMCRVTAEEIVLDKEIDIVTPTPLPSAVSLARTRGSSASSR